MNPFALGIAVASTVPGGRSALVLALVAVGVVAVGIARRLRDSAEGEDEREAEDGAETNSVWDAIPSWQYAGRHVESGGLARDEQERALREIQAQAAEIERDRESEEAPDRD